MMKKQGEGSYGHREALFDVKAARLWQESAKILETALLMYLLQAPRWPWLLTSPHGFPGGSSGTEGEDLHYFVRKNQTNGAIFLASHILILPACAITKEKKKHNKIYGEIDHRRPVSSNAIYITLSSLLSYHSSNAIIPISLRTHP